MDISVIIPVYGVEKYIERSLHSLFSQSKTTNVEFILVNDCTMDSSMKIARSIIHKYPSLDIKIIEHQSNKGLPSARQSGLNIAVGDYILHIDSDDWCEPNMLEELYAYAIKNNADVVVSDYYTTYPNKEIYCSQLVTNNNGLDCLEDMYKRKFNYGVWNKLIKKSIYTENNITTAPNINVGEDLILCSRVLCYAQNVVGIHKAYVHYIKNPDSLTAQRRLSTQNITSLFDGMNAIELFFKERGFDKIVKTSFNYRKALLKYQILMYCNKNEQKKYMNLYPEATGYIMGQVALSFPKRCALYFTKYGISLPLNMLRFIVRFLK